MAEVVLKLPRTTLTMDFGRVVRWCKAEGDAVREGETVAEVETDKAVVEVGAPIAGYLRQALAPLDVDLPVAAALAVFTPTLDEPLGQTAAGAASPVPPPALDEPMAPAERRAQASCDGGPPQPASAVRASPAVRRRAREADVDLRDVAGSGPRGRILLRDFETFLAARVPGAPAAPAEPVAPAAPLPGQSRMRAAIAAAMLRSWREQPQFTLTREVDMSATLALKAALAAAAPEKKLSVADFLIQAFARALPQHPSLNARLDAEAGSSRSGSVDFGIAVALEDGLVVPVLRGAERLKLGEIATARAELTARALAGTLRQDDLGAATFTMSNLGPFGVDEFRAIVNPGEAAIVAVGALRERPVAVDGLVAVRPTLRLTLAVDHRVADGAAGARLLGDVADRLEGRLGWILF